METSVPQGKPGTDPMITSERSKKRKNTEPESASRPNSSMKSAPQMTSNPSTTVESGLESSTNVDAQSSLLMETPRFRIARDRIDGAMKAQVSASRAMTVELNTIRDMMPMVRREIHAYSIIECQLVKELEEKAPSYYEHKDVRLRLVLDEIQRLRLNKRKALARLKEAQMRIVELESRMEFSSYEAGELFWDSKISELGREKHSAQLDILAAVLSQGSKAKGNLKVDPITRAASYDSMALESDDDKASSSDPRSSPADWTSGQELISKLTAIEIKQKIAAKPSEAKLDDIEHDAPDRMVTNANNSTMDLVTPASAQEAEQQTFSQSVAGLLDVDEGKSELAASPIDLEKIVSEAQERKELRGEFRKRYILIPILPVAGIIGLLLLDWQTGLLSRIISLLLGQ